MILLKEHRKFLRTHLKNAPGRPLKGRSRQQTELLGV